MNKKTTILGVNGGFGCLFSELISAEDQMIITGVDLTDKELPAAKCSRYLPSDLTVFNDEVKLLISESDLIIICLPEHITYTFLDLYRSYISKNSLLVDTLSVKSQIVSVYNDNGFNALSLNPMFGPDLLFEGKNMIVVKIKESGLSEWVISLLSTLKVNLIYLTSEEHDKMTSIVQVATHAAVMAFGITLNQSDVSVNELLKIATPPFLNICTLFSRITSGNKNVYWSIQKENIYASQIRNALINNLIALDKSIHEDHEEVFNQLIEPNTPSEKVIFTALSQGYKSK
jgi:prephenate dehydrogenase